MRDEVEVGEGGAARKLAVLARPGQEPAVVWLGGFRSEMTGTKADALDAWADREGRRFVRFDYSGHGQSGGRFEDGTVSVWLEDALAVIERFTAGRPVLVGSSMGAWIALLATRFLRAARPDRAPAALVLIAPATDFTERLMWQAFPEEVRRTILSEGVYTQPSLYSDVPYPITRALIEDGRKHLLLDETVETGCPVHILQGMKDPDVPWEHAVALAERLPGDSVQLTFVSDGDHRLSRDEDIERLVGAVDAAVRTASETAARSEAQFRLTV